MKNHFLGDNKKPFILSEILLSITLVFLILPAFYSRFQADDYCLAAISKTTPFWPYLTSVFNTWTGKFSYIGVLWFLGNLPPSSLGIILSVVCLVWVLLLAGLFRQLIKILTETKQTLISYLLAIILLVSLFYSIPNRFQNLYWLNGLVAYTFPILLFTATVSIALFFIFSKEFRSWHLAVLAVLSFLSCGFSEGPLIAVIAFYGSLAFFALLTKIRLRSNRISWSLLVLFLAGIAAFLVQYFAPGTSVRSSILSTRLPLIEAVLFTFRNVAHLYGKLLVFSPQWVLLAFFGSALTGLFLAGQVSVHQFSIKQFRSSWLIGFAVNFLVGIGVCGAVVYFMQAYPDDRIIFVPYFFAYLTIVGVGLLTGLWISFKQNLVRPFCKTMIKLGPIVLIVTSIAVAIISSMNYIKVSDQLRDYTERWDSRETLIRAELAAGQQDLIIYGLESQYGLSDLKLEKTDWVNNCMAGYYGAKSITGK